MGFFNGLWSLVLGVTGIASFFAERWSKRGRILLGVAQLVLGGIAVLWGWWGMTNVAISAEWIRNAPVYWTTMAVGAAIDIVLGLALFAGLFLALVGLRSHASTRSPLRRRVARAQLVTGILAVALAVWSVVSAVFLAL